MSETTGKGWYIGIGEYAPLFHCAGANPHEALADYLRKGVAFQSGELAWVWKAAIVRPELAPFEVADVGPVGDPRVFEISFEFSELQDARPLARPSRKSVGEGKDAIGMVEVRVDGGDWEVFPHHLLLDDDIQSRTPFAAAETISVRLPAPLVPSILRLGLSRTDRGLGMQKIINCVPSDRPYEINLKVPRVHSGGSAWWGLPRRVSCIFSVLTYEPTYEHIENGRHAGPAPSDAPRRQESIARPPPSQRDNALIRDLLEERGFRFIRWDEYGDNPVAVAEPPPDHELASFRHGQMGIVQMPGKHAGLYVRVIVHKPQDTSEPTSPGIEITDETTEVTEAGQLATEDGEQTRPFRIAQEVARMSKKSELEVRKLLDETVAAIWWAVEDLDAVPEGLHPADVVEKYLQRGNIEKDGKW